MSKIELLIQKAHGGLTDVFVTNKGAWYGKTYDMRNYKSHLQLTTQIKHNKKQPTPIK